MNGNASENLCGGTELACSASEAPVRTLEIVEMELLVIQNQTAQILLSSSIEMGRRLEEAKAMLHHGEWGDWLKKMGYAKTTAANHMRIFREYGAAQQSLFGCGTNFQALGNLSYTKALQLLALDAEEREQFAEEHDVEAMSTRELEKAIREQEIAQKKATAAKAEAEHAIAAAKTAEESCAKMAADMQIAKASLVDLEAQSEHYRSEAESLRSELKELRNKPIDVAVEVREPTPEELEQLTAAAVERVRAEDAERLRELESRLSAANDADTAAFRVLYESWQKAYWCMMDALGKITDAELADKFRNAVRGAAQEWCQ